jgi:hypothetical protein
MLVEPDLKDSWPNNLLLVARRTLTERTLDDAVAGCSLIVASSFRVFLRGALS